MPIKIFGNEGEDLFLPQHPALMPDARPSPNQKSSSNIVKVREPQKIQKKIRDFFKLDLKTGLPLPNDKKMFLSQVLMHEFDEGVRLLTRAGKMEVADMIKSAHPKMHLSNQLRLLRETLEDKTVSGIPPENIQQGYKIRNNQNGNLSGKLKTGSYYAFSSEGVLYKGRNEDALLIEPEREILAVLDGMGGHSGGNTASCVMTDFFEYGLKHGMSVEQAICFGNEAVMERAKNDATLGGNYPMGTTLVAAQIQGDKLKTTHVGDSKLLVIRQGKVVFETLDHTNGQSLYREGLIDVDTAHFLNHILSRNLGTDPVLPNRDLDRNAFNLKAGDRILLMTDGITDNFYTQAFSLDEIAQIASKGNLEDCAMQIQKTCFKRMQAGKLPSGYRSKPDNLSLIIYQYR